MKKLKNPKGKMSFTNNQLKGNWGELFIASKLAQCGCLVRHVTGGHDSGIDLYCESIKKGNPFLHFFVQVKTSNNYTKSNANFKDSFAEYNKEKIIYWLKQPVPVFIFLVPDERNINDILFYICSTLDFKNGKQKSIKPRFEISSINDLEEKFFGKNNAFAGLLIEETFNWSLSKGHLSPFPNAEKSLLRWFPGGVMNIPTNLENVSRTLHNALWRISEDLLTEIFDPEKLRLKEKKNKSNFSKIEPYMNALEAMLKTNNSSNVSRVTIGLWYSAKENYIEAQKWIEKGIKIAEENVKKQKYKNEKDHIEEQLKQSKQYLKMIKSRLKKNNLFVCA